MFTEDDVSTLVKNTILKAFDDFKKENYLRAEILLKQTLKVSPESYEAMQLLGLIYNHTGRYEQGVEILNKSLELDPDNYETYNNLGLCLSNLNKYQEAIDCLNKAIDLDPKNQSVLNNLAMQYKNIKNIEEAINCLKKSLEINDKNELTWSMLGGCYSDFSLKDYKKSEKCFKKAIKLNPNFSIAHVDLAAVYHLTEKWDKAWKEYEWRFDVFDQLKKWQVIYDPKKKWKGQSLENKKILVHGEQGFGDIIQFFRYVKFLKQKNAYVILHCHENLAVLLKDYVDEIYVVDPLDVQTDSLPNHHYHCPVLSLPHLLNIKASNIPDFCLNVKEKVDMSDYSGLLKIGIVWAGNPQHPNDSNRSCQLNNFSKIHDLPNVKLFSLVKDVRPRMYRNQSEPVDLIEGTEDMKIVDMSPLMNTFYDTAVIINSLDLVITVDTSILHLAGSMGKKTWAALPYNCDWRWSQKGESSVWYPSLKLFRQPTPGDWTSVFNEMLESLKTI